MAGLIPFNRNRGGLKPPGFEEFYNMLDDFFTDTWPSRRGLFGDTFKLDVKEENNQYMVEAELPGVKREEIDLELNEERLTISIRREENTNEEKENYIHRERRYSSMQRSVYLQDAKTDGITAKLEDGLLKIAVPKEDRPNNTHRIDIQ